MWHKQTSLEITYKCAEAIERSESVAAHVQLLQSGQGFEARQLREPIALQAEQRRLCELIAGELLDVLEFVRAQVQRAKVHKSRQARDILMNGQ